jgi:hypothetical protein
VAAQRLPFIESVTVLLPPAIGNFKESGVRVNMDLVTSGTGVFPESFFLQETENVMKGTIKRNKICNLFI